MPLGAILEIQDNLALFPESGGGEHERGCPPLERRFWKFLTSFDALMCNLRKASMDNFALFPESEGGEHKRKTSGRFFFWQQWSVFFFFAHLKLAQSLAVRPVMQSITAESLG